jgi:hypothetical protein
MIFFETCEGPIVNLHHVTSIDWHKTESGVLFCNLHLINKESHYFIHLNHLEFNEEDKKPLELIPFLIGKAVEYIYGSSEPFCVVRYVDIMQHVDRSFKNRKEPQNKKKVSDF